MNRIEYISSKYKEEISKKNPVHKDAFQSIIDADPSKNKKYTHWLMKGYMNNRYRFEDLYKANEYLSHFEKHKGKLDLKQRDINQYKTLAELWITLQPLVDEVDKYKSRSQVRDEEKDKAYSESIILFKNEEVRILIPTTKYAAQFHGRGTQWCTSADKNNMFNDYHKNSPLIIFDIKGAGKFQLYVANDDFQLMDSHDMEISETIIEEQWHIFKDIIISSMLNITEEAFYKIPYSKLTDEHVKYGLKNAFITLKDIPEKLRTRENIEILIEYAPVSVVTFYKTILDNQLWEKLIRKTPGFFSEMPSQMMTKEFCKEILQINPLILKDMPKEFIDKETCEIALSKNGLLLPYIPQSLLSKEIYELAVSSDGNAIIHVPAEYIDKEMIIKAVNGSLNINAEKEYPLILEHIPSKFIDYEFCEMLIKLNPRYIFELSIHKYNSLLDKDLYKLAVSQSGRMLRYVPERFTTIELMDLAFNNDKLAFQFFRERYKSYSYAMEYLKEGHCASAVPHDIITYEMCKTAIAAYPDNISNLPIEMMDMDLLSLFIEKKLEKLQKPSIIHIPDKFRKKIKEKYQSIFNDADKLEEKNIINQWKKQNIDKVLKEVFDIDINLYDDHFNNNCLMPVKELM